MIKLIMLFLAFTRISERAVCAMSAGPRDFHDWPDGVDRWPLHMHTHRCARCGKEFQI